MQTRADNKLQQESENFADRLVAAICRVGTPCIVGLDPRLELMPHFLGRRLGSTRSAEEVRKAISKFGEIIIEAVYTLVPAIKPQIAFYERYGLAGLSALAETIAVAKSKGMIVILDAKRNDIASTAEAYSHAFLDRDEGAENGDRSFEVDCLTVSPFLGRDSLEPFVAGCKRSGKGIFVLVKTSNAGSRDLQDQTLADGVRISEKVAQIVATLGQTVIGNSGYSSVGAVVGATFPGEAARLRALMPNAIVLVPGYGAQGGRAEDVLPNFDQNGLGALVSSSRGITYAYGDPSISEQRYKQSIHDSACEMIDEIAKVLAGRGKKPN